MVKFLKTTLYVFVFTISNFTLFGQQFEWVMSIGAGGSISPFRIEDSSTFQSLEPESKPEIPGFCFQFGAGFRYRPNRFLSFETSLLFNRVNSKYKTETTIAISSSANTRLYVYEVHYSRYYLSLPIQVRLEVYRFSVGFGYQFSKLGQSEKTESSTTNTLSQIDNATIIDSNNLTFSGPENHTNFDHGLFGSFNYRFLPRLELYLSYYHGIKNTYINPPFSLRFTKRNRQLMFGINYIIVQQKALN